VTVSDHAEGTLDRASGGDVNDRTEHLELPVLDSGESRVVSREALEVEALGDGGFKLLHSPAFVWGLAAGDVIDVEPAALSGFRLRSRGGNVAVVAAVREVSQKDSPAGRRLVEEIAALGGVCDGGPGRALVFTIPVRAGFDPIESVFNRFQGACEGAGWWYGNVLDRNDEPLGWWNEVEADGVKRG